MSEIVTDPAKDPHLPHMGRLGDVLCPRAPKTIAEARLDDGDLTDLAAKFAYTINRFTADWLAERLRISPGARGRPRHAVAERGADRGDHDDHRRQGHVPGHRAGPPARRAGDGGVRLPRAGAGEPGGVLGHAPVGVRQHPGGEAGARDRRPVRAWC